MEQVLRIIGRAGSTGSSDDALCYPDHYRRAVLQLLDGPSLDPRGRIPGGVRCFARLEHALQLDGATRQPYPGIPWDVRALVSGAFCGAETAPA